MKEFHEKSVIETFEELHTGEDGLTDKEAESRLIEYGENKLNEKKKKSLALRFFEQFKDVMIIILLIAAVISFVVACVGDDPMEFIEPALIVLIVILNAVLGLVQENKAEKALDALKNMSAPHARVIRGGTEHVISASEVVPGDIIRLEAGAVADPMAPSSSENGRER